MDGHRPRAKDRLLAEDGQTMTEYGLLLVLVAIALMGTIAFFSGGLGSMFSSIGSTLSSIASAF